MVHRLQLSLTALFIVTGATAPLAQTKTSPEYILLGTGHSPLQLAPAQKKAIFGSEQQFEEDSLLRVWRSNMLTRLTDIRFAEQVYSRDPDEYARYFPNDTAGLKRRFIAELREAAPFTQEQAAAIAYYQSYLRARLPPEAGSVVYSSVSGRAVNELATASLLGSYWKNKQGKTDWLYRKAKDALWLHYASRNSTQKLSEEAFEARKKAILLSNKD